MTALFSRTNSGLSSNVSMIKLIKILNESISSQLMTFYISNNAG